MFIYIYIYLCIFCKIFMWFYALIIICLLIINQNWKKEKKNGGFSLVEKQLEKEKEMDKWRKYMIG